MAGGPEETTVLPPLAPGAGVDERERLERLLRERRDRLGPRSGPVRFPVLAALVPVATDRGGEVAYPGDPMCLYAALGRTVERAVHRGHEALSPAPEIDDVVPDWGDYPSAEHRERAVAERSTFAADDPTSDGKVFDPRVWDEPAKKRFVAELTALRPRVLLLSAVSAAHRYALEMAELTREHVPECLVVLGGRHADETVTFHERSHHLGTAWSSSVEVIADGRAPRVVDLVVAGDGAELLDLLLRAVGLALTGPGRPDAGDVVRLLAPVAAGSDDLAGRGTVVAMGAGATVAQPVVGRPQSRTELPSPYQAFSVRARFEVFPDHAEGHPAGARTAHMMTIDACPFRCSFCSESIAVAETADRFAIDETSAVVEGFAQLVEWGARAVFFDDPVFWGGNWRSIARFSEQLAATVGPRERGLQWGAQLTVDVILNRAKQDQIVEALAAMRAAGCSYIYVGIESMDETIMTGIDKNLFRRNPEPWHLKVRSALEIVRASGINVGSSVLFGLDGETRETIATTIERIGRLIDDSLLVIASPNILTYHPATMLAHLHDQEKLDYHTRRPNRPPYTYFEEAYPEVVSRNLDEDDIWYIHEQATKRWGGVRNLTAGH